MKNELVNHFMSMVKCQADGRYIMKLSLSCDPASPWRSSRTMLLNNFSLEHKLSQDIKLKQDYIDFLNEYLENDEWN